MKKLIVGFIILTITMALFCLSVVIAFAAEEKPLDPLYTEPTDLTARFGDKLESVTLPDNWAWKDSSLFVGNVNETGNLFTAIYTPTDEQYRKVEKELKVIVKKAIIRPGMVIIKNGGNGSKYMPVGIIKNQFPSEGHRFLFSLTEDGDYQEKITLTNKTGEYTIYYQIIGENVETFTGSATVNITGYTWVTVVILIINLLAIGLATFNIFYHKKIKKVNKQNQSNLQEE